MKVLFCGLGSIGTRHLKNLHAVAARKGVPVQAYAPVSYTHLTLPTKA